MDSKSMMYDASFDNGISILHATVFATSTANAVREAKKALKEQLLSRAVPGRLWLMRRCEPALTEEDVAAEATREYSGNVYL